MLYINEIKGYINWDHDDLTLLEDSVDGMLYIMKNNGICRFDLMNALSTVGIDLHGCSRGDHVYNLIRRGYNG